MAQFLASPGGRQSSPARVPPVLVVDDDREFLFSTSVSLRAAGIEPVLTFENGREILPFLLQTETAAIVLDATMSESSGAGLLEKLREEFPQIPVIVVARTADVDTIVRFMKAGAFDCFVKPVESRRLVSTVRGALELRESRRGIFTLQGYLIAPWPEKVQNFHGIVTHNRKMHSIFAYVEAVAKSPHPVLITGETGVGKELVARAIHDISGREKAFLAVNIAGLDDAVFSDTLLGHRRGAYTGAYQDREGLIARASGGTLFLDEIGDLETRSQVKLLRLLEEGEYYPLGSDDPRKSDARILCATHHDLPALVDAGRFRKDLYFRLRAHHVHVPPLRERMDDLPLLVDYCLEQAARSLGKRKPTPPAELVKLLGTYDFPGNVRELQSLIYDAVARHRGGVLSIESVQEALAGRRGRVEYKNNDGPPGGGNEVPFEIPTRFPTRKEADDYLVSEALRRAGGNQGIAAHMLGITREALNKRLVKQRKLVEGKEGKDKAA